MEHEGSSFLAGCVATANVFFFAKEDNDKTKAGYQNSTFFALNDKGWSQYSGSVDWACIAMGTIKPEGAKRTVVAIGVHGEWWEMQPATVEMKTGIIDSVRYHLRTMRVVGGSFFAAGMGRMVFHRRGPGVWEAAGPASGTKSEGIVGFEDLDGYSESEIYAVGWQGEIWTRQIGTWSQIDSPTSVNLNAVCCAGDGFVYAVGDGGVMLKGRGQEWEIIETGRSENLMDVADHAGQVYVVTDFRILKLGSDGLVVEDDFTSRDDLPATCLFLERGPEVLLSLGPQDLLKLADASWTALV